MRYIDREYVDKINYKYNQGEKISRRKNIFYRNMQYTLNDSVYYVLNKEEKVEWANCYNNVEYFIEKYLDVTLRPYQKKWIKLYLNNKRCIYNVARQTGINTILSAVNLHSMIFHNNNIILITCKYDSGQEFLNLVKKYYFKLPYFLKPSVISINQNVIQFTNSKIKIKNSTLNDEDLSEYDIHEYHDYAHLKTPPLRDLVEHDSKIIITSTPNGKNHFYDLVNTSLLPDDHPDKNVFTTIKTYWYEVEGRDEKWKQEQIKKLGGLDKFNQEYNLEF